MAPMVQPYNQFATQRYPIENLRGGNLLLSHPMDGSSNGICDSRCVSNNWDTPNVDRASSMAVVCQRRKNPDFDWEGNADVYWACGNPRGMHFTAFNSIDTGAGRAPLCAW